MCGIVGILTQGDNLTRSDHETVKRMGQLLNHRGPSQQGFHCDERFALGNTRLSIIDPSSNSDLPMSNSRGNLWIAYNGEVSNYLDLKKKFALSSKYEFKGYSDTEVVLNMYQEFGISCLQHFSGMFAFCIVDLAKMKAFVIRDFYGINPLFYADINNKLYFASELKAFFEIDSFNKKVDEEAIFHFGGLGYIPGILTPFRQIKELQGGHYIEFDLQTGRHSIEQYYDLKYQPNYDLSEETAAQKTYDLMLDSVRRNLISDAPLGMTLSGGVDTSTILSLVKELGKSDNMHTFSLKMGESSFDESKFQRIMSKHANTTHHEIIVGPDRVEENLIEHMAFLEEPTVNGAAIPSYILAKEAKQYVDVLLSGEGGDEVFNAYDTYAAYKWRKLYRSMSPSWMRSLISASVSKLPVSHRKLSLEFKLKRFTTGVEKNIPESHYHWRHVFNRDEQDSIFRQHSFKNTSDYFSDLFYSSDFEDDLDRLSKIDINYFFIADLMVKNDRTFLGNSVEGRFPFMDRMLVDFVSTIPASMRMKGFKRRYIEKKAVEKILPQQILTRSSFGLEMPHAFWLRKELKPFAEKYLNKKVVERSGFLNWAPIQRMWGEHLSGKRDNGRPLWGILKFLIWFDLFLYNGDFKNHLKRTT